MMLSFLESGKEGLIKANVTEIIYILLIRFVCKF
jgi:hypothetical protein